MYVAATIIILIGAAIFRFFNPSLGFKYFEPSYLPPNISIKEKRIAISSGFVTAEQNFRTVDWVYEIQEYKADSSIGSADQKYDVNSTEPSCSILTSFAGQQYRLCHWIDYGRIGVYEVKFIKDGTFISSQVPTTLQQKLNVSEISQYVDSFKLKSSIGIPVLRSSGP